MLSRYSEDERYSSSDFIPLDQGNDLPFIVPEDNSQIDQVTVPQVTANQNNYPLPPGGMVIFTTDASRNFTGFVGARPGLTVFYNGGSFDGVIVNNSGSSTAENRV